MLGVRLVFVLVVGVLLASCASTQDEVASNVTNTFAQPAEEASPMKPANVVEAAAAEIGESSIRTSLSYLTGASPAPLASSPTTIAERASEN